MRGERLNNRVLVAARVNPRNLDRGIVLVEVGCKLVDQFCDWPADGNRRVAWYVGDLCACLRGERGSKCCAYGGGMKLYDVSTLKF